MMRLRTKLGSSVLFLATKQTQFSVVFSWCLILRQCFICPKKILILVLLILIVLSFSTVSKYISKLTRLTHQFAWREWDRSRSITLPNMRIPLALRLKILSLSISLLPRERKGKIFWRGGVRNPLENWRQHKRVTPKSPGLLRIVTS